MIVTKAGLEQIIKQQGAALLESNQTIALQSMKIYELEKLLKFNPHSGIFMSMMSTNKLARRMVESLTELINSGRLK